VKRIETEDCAALGLVAPTEKGFLECSDDAYQSLEPLVESGYPFLSKDQRHVLTVFCAATLPDFGEPEAPPIQVEFPVTRKEILTWAVALLVLLLVQLMILLMRH